MMTGRTRTAYAALALAALMVGEGVPASLATNSALNIKRYKDNEADKHAANPFAPTVRIDAKPKSTRRQRRAA
jgi:hypothetical protein